MTDPQEDPSADEDSVDDPLGIAQDDLDEAIRLSTIQGFLTIEQRLLFSVAGAQLEIARRLGDLALPAEALTAPTSSDPVLEAQVQDGLSSLVQRWNEAGCPQCGGYAEGGEINCPDPIHEGRR